MNTTPEYIVDRVFKGPVDLVWKAWTDPELLARWYGPNVETIVHKFDLQAGGEWLNEMKMGGQSHYSKAVFQEVVDQQKLVWHHSSTDEDWNIAGNAMMPDWPKTLLTIVTFEPAGNQAGNSTNVKLTWIPHDASDAEIACFEGAMANMGKGWEGGFGIIDDILAELQNA